MNCKFKVGDRVKHPIFGKGIVKYIDSNDPILCYAVEFNKANDDLHNCGGRTYNNHGYWCVEDEIYPISASNLITCFPDIHVSFNITKGITTAKFISPEGKALKTCIAKRDPDDAWDSYIGANIAIARLFNKDPHWDDWDKSYDMSPTVEYRAQISNNGKFVCISETGGFTIGKIYKMENNVMTNDLGQKRMVGDEPDFEKHFLKIVE